MPELPSVYRFVEKVHVEAFFANGTLMVSTFARFKTLADEQRRDGMEGLHLIGGSPGGAQLVGFTESGFNSYVLCGSTSREFGQAAIEIVDVDRFTSLVAEALGGVTAAFHGPCIYTDERITCLP